LRRALQVTRQNLHSQPPSATGAIGGVTSKTLDTNDTRQSRGPGWRSTALAAAASWLIALAAVLFFDAACSAREPAEEFIAGLRGRGLHELTLDYLSRMETSRLADAEFRRRIGYHRGVTLIALARQTVDPDQRADLLDRARAELEQYSANNSDNGSGAEALMELANVLVDQAKQGMAEARQLPEGAAYEDQREAQHVAARRWLEQAEPMYRRAETFYSRALDEIPQTLDPKTQSDLITRRQEYRGRLAQASVLAAQAQFETAATYPPDSVKFRQLNERAAKELSELFDKYSRWLVGFFARLYEGRCYQALDDYQRALGCYEELIGQPSMHPEFRKLIASAHGYKAECLLAQGNVDAAIASSTTWLNGARDDEQPSPEWLMVRFHLAEALRQKAESTDTPASQRRRLLAEAHDAYRLVAESPSEFQRPARLAAAALREGDAAKRREPRDFSAAYEAGKEAMASVNAAKLALPSAARNNPSAMPELRMQMEEGKENARQYFRMALSLVDDDTDLERLNEIRYFLCWLCWENKEYYQAAVLGEFLARRYPEHPASPAAAKIALASYERLQQETIAAGGSSHDTEFEARRMARVAEFITRRWPGTRAAETALRVLVSYAIRTDQIDDAKALLNQVSASARPALESQLGNAIWARYLERSQQSGPDRPDDQSLERLRREAVNFLTAGYSAAGKSGEVTETQATSALYLVQALLSEGKYREAISLLERPKVGPLAHVLGGQESARPEYAIEVYKAALRAYVSVTPPEAQKAVDTMERLEQAARNSGNDRTDQLTRIYISLTVALGQQIEQLRDSGRDDEAARVSTAFAEFLDQVSARQQNGSWDSRFWIAETYYSMGQSLASGGSRETTERFFTKSRDAYRQLLADAATNPGMAPSPAALLAAKRQLGECYRQLGEYKQALDTFSAVLKDEEAQLSVQKAAALTYQAWGEEGDARWLERAIYGGYKLRSTGKNRIWGWLKLALVAERAARSNSNYRDAFFEARLEAARCRYLIGVKSSGAAKQQHLATAQQSIRSLVQLYPDVGGNNWRGKFESLLKQIQRAAGDKPVGLSKFAASAP
jgi:tetratricopeptide (TPR) repeat protein